MKRLKIILTIIIATIALCSCTKTENNKTPGNDSKWHKNNNSSSPGNSSGEENGDESVSYNNGQVTVLVPTASDVLKEENETVSLDYSNASEGYIMISYKGSNEKVKLQITGNNNITYTYNMENDGYEVFPLTSQSGSYGIKVFENIQKDEYSTVFATSIDVNITNEFGPYLYPSKYVNFNSNTKCVELSKDFTKNAKDEIDVVTNAYNYIINNFEYDYDKAKNVQSGYIPNLDEIFSLKKGICFDYASLTACVLRVQGIPTRLEIGYVRDIYHAWISIYTQKSGWINGIIKFNGTSWELMDPTMASSSTSTKPEDFTADKSDYQTKYVY
ncbi:Transglutaminase-like superfamily protein [Acetitomaculum ruminis DSM 5522]|uniref:Transglutaminase-like superfamily protein n=1 Tax=Acetitomaculum ruminis DSM 5522 TaxID=1120918 RepID=A0A1I0XSX3_9FIRM|nr:transglutaminase-like domain-containing protein [Acetitomaculum ruminis]SFB03278.1 Transglutaminase-like superfamily protein [Acetitomaculum ruminis DSM 5522]